MKKRDGRKKFDEGRSAIGNLAMELEELDKIGLNLSDSKGYDKAKTLFVGGGFLTITCC